MTAEPQPRPGCGETGPRPASVFVRHARRPKVGEFIEHPAYGRAARITRVHGPGLTLDLDVPERGAEQLTRAPEGWWVVVADRCGGRGWVTATPSSAEKLSCPDCGGHNDPGWFSQPDSKEPT